MISSKQDLADFCLRQNGAPVVNIEIDDEQLNDAIELSIQYFNEQHFEGIERDYIKVQITPTKITLTSATGFVVNQNVQFSTGSTKIISISGNDIYVDKVSGALPAVGMSITNGVDTTTITAVTLGPMDSRYFELPDSVFSVLKVLNTANMFNSSELLFNFQYQLMYNEVQRITSSGGIQYFVGTMNYLAHLDFFLKKEKTFRFNRKIGKIFLDINWDIDVKMFDYLVFEVYMALDPEVYTKVYNDRWLKKYATAMVKKQWGTNTKKFSGMSLPGGVTYNGQQIFDEAVQELQALEEEAIDQGAPLGMFIG